MAGLDIRTLSFNNNGPYDLHIEPGECVCITGASGSGKTLLLRSIADLDDHKGCVRLNDTDANTVPAAQWRKLAGMLPATSAWWSDTVGDHFQIQTGEILTQLGFEPDVMNWQVKRLSTGEKQRLAIVRLLIGGPRALLLDEPTASLDSANVSRVEKIICNYMTSENVPVLWVSHDQEQVKRIAHRHLVLEPSQLTEQTGS